MKHFPPLFLFYFSVTKITNRIRQVETFVPQFTEQTQLVQPLGGASL